MNDERDKLGADLSAYLDDELSAARSREIQRVLASSEDARRQLDELREVSEQLGALPRLRAPAELASTLAAQAEQQLRAAPRAGKRRMRIIRLGAQVTAAAAVIVAGVLVGYQIMQEQTLPGSPVLAPSLQKSDTPAPAAAPARGIVRDGRRDVELAARWPEQPQDKLPVAKLPAPVFEAAPEPDELTRQEGVARDFEESEAKVLAVAPAPTATVHVVIRAQDEDQYARNVTVLAQWSAAGAPAAAPAVATASADEAVAAQPGEQLFYVVPSELPARIDQLLAVNTRDQVRYEANFEGDADTAALLAPVVSALQDRGVPWAGDVLKPGTPAASSREKRAAGRGGGATGRGRLMYDQARADEAEALHRRHLAVTAEPELTIVFVPEPEPPAREAGEQKRGVAPAARGARPMTEAAPAGGVLASQPASGTSAERLLELSLSGPKADDSDFDGVVDAAAEQRRGPISLRVTLLPPGLPDTPAPPATTPASQPAR